MFKRIIFLLAVGAILMMTFAAPALAKNSGEQKLEGAQGPPEWSGAFTSVFHCQSPNIIGTRGVVVTNKKGIQHNNCDEELPV